MKARLRGARAALIGCVALLGLAQNAMAGELGGVNASLEQIRGERVRVHLSGSAGLTTWHWIDAGELEMQRLPGDPGADGITGIFSAFSVALTSDLKFHDTHCYEQRILEQSPQARGGMPDSDADDIRELVGRFYSPGATATALAALQVAIWEVAYDGTTRSVRSGDFRAASNDAVTHLAQSYLNQITGDNALRQRNTVSLASEGSLDLITVVPAPGALALLALSGVVMLARRR